MTEPETRLFAARMPRPVAAAVSTLADGLRGLDLGALTFALSESLDDVVRLEGPRIEPVLTDTDANDLVGAPVALVLEHVEDAARLVLELDEALVHALIGHALEAAPRPVASTYLGPVERGVLAYAVASVIDRLPECPWLLRAVVVTHDAILRAMPRRPHVRARYALVGPHHRSSVRVSVPLSLRLPTASRPVAEHLEITCGLVAGRATLPRVDLEAARPGDTVVLDVSTWSPTRGGSVGLVPDGTDVPYALSAYDGDALRIVRVAPPHDVPAPKGTIAMSDSSSPLPADLPIVLTVEIGRVRLTLGELGRLTEGSVLATGHGVPASVILRAGDAPYAEGTLVEVDGEVGVRITRLLRPAT